MILPHVGLVVLLIVYLLIGAIVFRYLEAPNELEVIYLNIIDTESRKI